jgi:hypothetical protein
VTVDRQDNLFIADSRKDRSRTVSPTGIITKIVGRVVGYSGDGGLARSAPRIRIMPVNMGLEERPPFFPLA